MSLQVWLPLTGHLNNQGLSNVTVTNNGATVDNNGKIGKCYAFSSTYIKTTDYANLGDTFSVSFWIYITVASSSVAICATRKVTYGGLLISTSSGKLTIDSAPASPSSSTRWITSYTIPTNTWTHIVVTRTSTLVSYYVNGEFGASKSTTYADNYGNTLTIGCLNTDGSSYTAYFAGKLNDFRIYDHALSAKEVKELSKGLVLHYPLSAGFGGAENLFRDSAMGQHAIDNFVSNFSEDWTKYFRFYNGTAANHSFADGIDTITLASGSNIGICFCRKATDIALDSSSYYTISCEAKCEVSGAHLDIGLSYYNTSNAWVWRGGSNPKNFTAVDTWQKFTHTFKPDSNTQYIMYCFTVNSTTNKHFSIKHCKLEKGSVATPWTMNSGDVELADIATTEYDVSGYNYHGTKLSTITYDSDTARYNISSYFNGTDAGILIENLYISNIINTAVTYSFWIKPNGENGARSVYFGSFNGTSWSVEKTVDNVLRLYWNGSPDESCAGAAITDNVWQHICITKNGTNDVKVYINGVQKWSSTATHNTLTFPTTYRIGRDVRTGDGTPYKGLMSDFRIYATPLSADDVKELYNTAASLANNGTLFAYDFVEV